MGGGYLIKLSQNCGSRGRPGPEGARGTPGGLQMKPEPLASVCHRKQKQHVNVAFGCAGFCGICGTFTHKPHYNMTGVAQETKISFFLFLKKNKSGNKLLPAGIEGFYSFCSVS